MPEGPWPPRGRVREFHPSPEVIRLFDESDKDGFYFAIWSRDASPIKLSSNAPPGLMIPPHADETQTHIRERKQLREAFHFTEFGDCVLAGRPVTSDVAALRRFALWLLAAGGAVLAFGLGGGWWLATRAIRPIENIIAAASRISEGKLSERVSGASADSELGRLASVLNSTFARLEAAFARQQQFTTDASHELRTPLAVLISEAQTALARQRTAPEYRETLEYSLAAAQQMRRLTDALLELSRFDANQDQIPRSPLNLAPLAHPCVERLQPFARDKQVQIHCDLQPATVLGNADRFGQVVTNLVSNAIHYNKPSGEIRVSTRLENGEAVLVVADTGQGIGEDDLPHIFERFYRADKSRSRSEGRYGLGLAICKAIVEGEGGRIEVTSRLGEGSSFTVHLPAQAARPAN
jgi:heavy metal sensor kinase